MGDWSGPDECGVLYFVGGDVTWVSLTDRGVISRVAVLCFGQLPSVYRWFGDLWDWLVSLGSLDSVGITGVTWIYWVSVGVSGVS
jgi:hypothetical protein